MDISELLNKIHPKDNEGNQTNANKGSTGTNLQYDQAQGNRGKQLNPNQNKVSPDTDDMDEGDVFWHDNSD
ncbi:hypothetical protein [Pseudomonas sp.]|uniref:hypothetical protein n=1 Tax=Pseudomonas sp. TaxID=306 RepID=UPI003C773335